MPSFVLALNASSKYPVRGGSCLGGSGRAGENWYALYLERVSGDMTVYSINLDVIGRYASGAFGGSALLDNVLSSLTAVGE